MERNAQKKSMHSGVVIVNQRSGSGFSPDRLKKLVCSQANDFNDLIYAFPTTRDEAIETAYSSARNGVKTVMVWGGDGSINAVLQGLMRAKIEGIDPPSLVLLGGGSGSDFIRSLELRSVKSEWALDVGKIEILNEGAVRYFINGFSFGVTAEIADMKNLMPRWLPGRLKYLLATLLRLARGGLYSHARIDDVEHDGIISAMILNGQFVGGGMRILDESGFDDGIFEKVILPKMSLWSILRILKSVYRNGIRHHREISITSTSGATEVKLPKMTWCECDGETFRASHLRVSIEPQAVQVMTPELL